MPERSFRVFLWSLALVGLTADQVSKYGVFSWLHGVETHSYALFQTAPESRKLSVVPLDPDPSLRMAQRGFFLEVAFEADEPFGFRDEFRDAQLRTVLLEIRRRAAEREPAELLRAGEQRDLIEHG